MRDSEPAMGHPRELTWQHGGGLGRLASAGVRWWAWKDSNLRPRPYQGRALAN